MKRILLFTLLISFIGYSQNPIQPNHPNFKDDLPQDLVKKMNSLNLEFGDDGMIDLNPNQRFNYVKLQSLQSEMMVQSYNDITYRLDGYTDIDFIKEIENKRVFEYNENGDKTLFIWYNWDTNSQSFIPYQKTEYTYDDNGNQTLLTFYSWNIESQSFVINTKYEYTYDINYREVDVYFWDTNSQSFVLNGKTEYTYDDNGNLTVQINYNLNTYFQSLEISQKREFIYDENGNKTLEITFGSVYNGNSNNRYFDYYYPRHKQEINYDVNENITLNERYDWNMGSETYILRQRREYTYDVIGNILIRLEKKWGTTGEFDSQNKREYSYDENGNNTLFLYHENEFNNEQNFVLKSKDEYTYDEHDNRIVHIYHSYNSSSESLVPVFRNNSSYDEYGNLILLIEHDWTINSGTNNTYWFQPTFKYIYTYGDKPYPVMNKTKIQVEEWYGGDRGDEYNKFYKLEINTQIENDTNLVNRGVLYEYDSNSNTWSELQGEEFKSYWYYTKTPPLSTYSVESNSFSIYPNPTSNTLQINSSEYLRTPIFELYDVKGSKILSNPFKLTEPIDVSDLQPSMYIYNIKDGSEVKQSGKVLIE